MAINKDDLNQELLSLYDNEEFSQKILTLENKSTEAYYEVAKSYLSNMSMDKFVADAKMIEDYYRSIGKINDGEMGEDGLLEMDNLDEVAGGVIVIVLAATTIT